MYYSPIQEEPYYRDKTKEFNRHLTRAYGFMAGGLAITFLVALLMAYFFPQTALNPTVAIVLAIVEIVTVIAFSATLTRASYGATLGMFLFYSLLNGASISYIFLYYDLNKVFYCFAAAAISFAIMAILGHTTKRELSGFLGFFIAGLFGLLFLTVIGFFLKSSALEIVIACIGLILFLGITAFDAQRLRRFYESASEDDAFARKFAVYSALQLYLDFINIFFYLLRLFDRNRK